jgi:hypothetical protein
MSPLHMQSVAEISQELGIHVITLYMWRKAWRLQGEVVPATQKEPEGWGPADKFTWRWRPPGSMPPNRRFSREQGLFSKQLLY